MIESGKFGNQTPPVGQQPPEDHSTINKIKEYAVWVFRLILNTIIEVAEIIFFAVTFVVKQTWFDPKECVDTGNPNKDIPIILVHGYLHNSSAWILQRYWLNKAGYKNVFTVNLGALPFGKSIDADYASELEKRVNEVMQMSKIKEVRLIGHSMGGLVSSHYALHMEHNGIKVRDIITLLSPLQGTKMAHVGPGQCATQMMTNHQFNRTLSGKIENPNNINFYHFGSDTDLLVGKKSALNGKDEGKNRYDYDGGHCSILLSPKVNRQIVEILDSAEGP